MRRGAASCRAVLCGCRRCGGDGRGGRCRHRRAVMDGRAPPTRQPERGWASPAPVAVAVAVEDVRTPDTPLVACPRPLSAGRTSVHWVGRTSGVHATGVHATGAILVSGRTRLR